MDLDAPFESGAPAQAGGGAIEQTRRPKRRRAPEEEVQKLQRRENMLHPAQRAGRVAGQDPSEIKSQARERDAKDDVAENPEEPGQARGCRGAVDQDFRLGPVERHEGMVPESALQINAVRGFAGFLALGLNLLDHGLGPIEGNFWIQRAHGPFAGGGSRVRAPGPDRGASKDSRIWQ